jgi:UDP-N-acetylmuramyl pentapeptide phosphotransferase/UDP-N-acetylglucosamine-1-phosphate transferase
VRYYGANATSLTAPLPSRNGGAKVSERGAKRTILVPSPDYPLQNLASGVRDRNMREVLWFCATLAGSAMLTALAILVALNSPFWRDVLAISAYTLLISAVLIFLDMRLPLRERRKRMVPLIGMIASGFAFFGFSVWYFWPMDTSATKDTGQKTTAFSAASSRPAR